MACVLSPADGDEASFQSGTEVHSSVRSVTATRNGISMAGQSISARPYRTARLQGVPAAARPPGVLYCTVAAVRAAESGTAGLGSPRWHVSPRAAATASARGRGSRTQRRKGSEGTCPACVTAAEVRKAADPHAPMRELPAC